MVDLHVTITARSLVASQAHSLLEKFIDTSSFLLGKGLPRVFMRCTHCGLAVVDRVILRCGEGDQDGSTKR